MQEIEPLKALFSASKNIVITTHHKPDADALGSSLGMSNYLKRKGHNVTVITPTDYPTFLHWMKGNEDVLIFNEGNEEKTQEIVDNSDVIIALDFSALSRINELGEIIDNSKAYKINIDHHLNPEDFADFQISDTKAAATCEMCYELIVKLGDRHLIDADIADCLYAGIMTDTGGFRHSNTSKNVHEVVANLIELGAKNDSVAKKIYDNNSLNRLKFLGFALSEKLIVLSEYSTAYFAITSEELSKYKSKTGDTEGLVNYALSLQGIVFAALFTDRKEAIKMSFRSIGEFPANEIASKFFNGGGHRNAAGGRTESNLEDTVSKFKEILPIYKALLDKEKERKI